MKRGYGVEAEEIFERRIGYCLELHNESFKVGWYPLIDDCVLKLLSFVGYAVPPQCSS